MMEGFDESDLNLRSTKEIKRKKINVPYQEGIRMRVVPQ